MLGLAAAGQHNNGAVTPHEDSEADHDPEQPAQDPTEALVGQVLGERYKLLQPLGRGGMGVVFQARHLLLNKLVAVKVLRAERVTTKTALARFHREAMAAASIGDPHIVDVTDYGFTDEGNAYIVMEQLEGCDLRAVLKQDGALNLDRFDRLLRQMLKALASAHARGIVHRDLKPDNVFITTRDSEEFVKLLDFGISKVLITDSDVDTWLTSTDVVMGTPYFMAPEQATRTSEVDHRADIYSLGVMMYQMLTGEVPFSGATPLEVLMKHAQEAPVAPRQRRPDLGIPADLDALVMAALAKEPDQRPASAEALLAALDGAPLPRVEPAEGPAQRPRRGPQLITLAGGGALVLGLATLLFLKLYPATEAPPLDLPTRLVAADQGAASVATAPTPDARVVVVSAAPDAAAGADTAAPSPPTAATPKTPRRVVQRRRPPRPRKLRAPPPAPDAGRPQRPPRADSRVKPRRVGEGLVEDY